MTETNSSSGSPIPGAVPPGPVDPGSAPVSGSVSRPWLPVAIACGVAALLLIILLIPGVLRYPDDAEVVGPDPNALAAQQEVNRSLEEQIASLRRLVDANVCVADGTYQVPPGAGVMPQDWQALPPAAPGQTPMPQTSLPPDSPPFTGSLLDYVDEAVVLILAEHADGIGQGTGFLVSQNQVMTNAHITQGMAPGGKIFLFGKGIGVARAQVVAQSPDDDAMRPDFALLSFESETPGPYRPFVFAPTPPRLSHVVAAGYPGIILDTDANFQAMINGTFQDIPEATTTEGVVNAIQQGQGVRVLVHSAQISHGNSGGPLLDQCGRVVGVNTWIRNETDGSLHYSQDPESAMAFLRQAGVTLQANTDPCIPGSARAEASEAPADEPPATTEQGAGPAAPSADGTSGDQVPPASAPGEGPGGEGAAGSGAPKPPGQAE